MAATLSRLVTKRDRIDETTGQELRRLVQEFSGLSDKLRGELIAEIDRRTASKNGWTFVMLSPEQNKQVVRWLLTNSLRPQVAVDLWAHLFTALRTDTGEIMLTRVELADALEIQENTVSEIMTELESIGAISRRRQRVAGLRGPGMVRYFMNPRVATSLTGSARDKAQNQAPLVDTQLSLFAVIEGGKR